MIQGLVNWPTSLSVCQYEHFLVNAFSGIQAENIAPKQNEYNHLQSRGSKEKRYKYTSTKLQQAYWGQLHNPFFFFFQGPFPCCHIQGWRVEPNTKSTLLPLATRSTPLANPTFSHCNYVKGGELSGTQKSYKTENIFQTPACHMPGGNASVPSLSSPGIFSAQTLSPHLFWIIRVYYIVA